MGLDNVHLMVPFCRTPEEGRGVIKALADNGLVQEENGLKDLSGACASFRAMCLLLLMISPRSLMGSGECDFAVKS